MDPITHAASGAAAALACAPRPRSVWVVPLAALASTFPDVDALFAPGPAEFLSLHRGITHSLFAAPFLGLVLAALMVSWWRGRTPGAWPFRRVWALATGLVALHIWLDCVTTYGTMIFQPFSDYRVRLNGVFIVDALLLLPVLPAIWYGRSCRSVAVLGVAWVLAYPALCVGLRVTHERHMAQHLERQGVAVSQMTVLPDALAPFFWRALYETPTPYPPPSGLGDAILAPSLPGEADSFVRPPASSTVWQQGLDWRGAPRTPACAWPAADPEQIRSLTEADGAAGVFFRFTLMPVREQLAPASASRSGGATYRFFDLRFASELEPVRAVMGLRRNGGLPFQLQAREEEGRWTALRMLLSGAGRESSWQAPRPRRRGAWWEWPLGAKE